ncbi:MAG: rRNA pseudouridine synthase [Alphaproteobacteria bacterium]|nr:rRNA pseudouridine synthase [Alphaproteobacteria bacterium]
MMKKQERIAKRIAAAGICSRRDAERLISAGRVLVNGKTLETPACLVGDDDIIKVDGKTIFSKPATRVWLYHKPTGLITTARDPQGRPTVFESLPADMPRVISVGRLDLNSEGLLLLTNDGEWARKMELPSSHLKRTYRVRVHGKIPVDLVEQLGKGRTVAGVRYAPCQVKIEKGTGANSWLEMTLEEGKNREIRKLMASFGIQVARLIRISYGPYELGDLEKGKVKEVKCV